MSGRLDIHLYREDLARVLETAPVDFLEGRRILVTGGTGLVGTFLIDVLMEANRRGSDIHVVTVGRNRVRAEERFRTYLADGWLSFLQHDVTMPLPDDCQFDIAIGCASLTHPLAYSQQPIETILTNVEGTRNLLEKAAELGGTVMFLSSVEIYGNSRDGRPFMEDDTGALDLSTARSGYTESKRVAEALCQAYAAERGLDVRIARLCRVFGATLLESDTKASSQFLFMAAAGEDVVLKSSGDQFFSYLHVSDAVAAILAILAKGAPTRPYNVADPSCDIRLRDFARIAAACAGTKVLTTVSSENERRGYSIATTALLSPGRVHELGWRPALDAPAAIARTIAELKLLLGSGIQ